MITQPTNVATCGFTSAASSNSRGTLPTTATTPDATAVASGTLNMVAHPNTAKKLAAIRAVQTIAGWPSLGATGAGETPAIEATSHTPMAMASSTIAA